MVSLELFEHMGRIKMKEQLSVLAIVFMMVLGSFGAIGAVIKNLENETDSEEFAPGELIVGFYEDSELQSLDIQPISVSEIDQYKEYKIKRKIENLNIAVIQVEEGAEKSLVSSLLEDPAIKFVEPNYVFHLYGIPNDELWVEQYGPKRIHCQEAWDSGTAGGVKIAIVDTGVDYTHEDLAGRVISGHDFVNDDDDPIDDNNHGTHCAGIAAAIMNNDIGIVGVSQATIIAEKVLSSSGSGYSDWVAGGIDHAVDMGADVISLSLGSSSSSNTIKSACARAYVSDVVVCSSSGNDGSSSGPGYPAAYSSVIAVGAIDSKDLRCDFSNYGGDRDDGTGLEVVAPGYRIISTVHSPSNSYKSYSGTSMACPHVAGVAALYIAKNPGKNAEWIRNKIRENAEDLYPEDPDDGNQYGHGLVDARVSPDEPENAVKVYFDVKKIKLLDTVDTGTNTGDLFYKVELNSDVQYNYNGHDEPFLWFSIFVFDPVNTWTHSPATRHTYTIEDPQVPVKITLYDDDALSSVDYLDICDRNSDDVLGGPGGRIFEAKYDLIDDEIIDSQSDTYWEDGDWLYTTGDKDNSEGNPEGPLDWKQDDAKFWFKISDNYNAADYLPTLTVDPTSLGFGTITKGESATKTLTINNEALPNDPFGQNEDMSWTATVTEGSNWISLDDSSDTAPPAGSDDICVTIGTSDLSSTESGKLHEGNIQVSAGSQTKNVPVTITVKSKARTINTILLGFLQSQFPNLFDLLEVILTI